MSEQKKLLETGKWYPITAPGYVCADGSPYYGGMRRGTENCLLIMFDGGGASWSPCTAARPHSLMGTCEDTYYTDWLEPVAVMQERTGIESMEEWNPFRNWNVINVNCATGDFHIGNTDYPYQALTGEEKILHHHGYRNYRMVLETAMKSMKDLKRPEKVLIAGSSAGAFGVTALADEIIREFPDGTDITCCVDGAMIYGDWKKTLKTWNVPKEIQEKVCGDNIVQDCLLDLYHKYGNKIRYTYMCSVRDGVLSWFQKRFRGGDKAYTKEIGIDFYRNLQKMCAVFRKEIPEMGLFLYDYPLPDADPAWELTQHTILLDCMLTESVGGRESALEWLWKSVNGQAESVGLELL